MDSLVFTLVIVCICVVPIVALAGVLFGATIALRSRTGEPLRFWPATKTAASAGDPPKPTKPPQEKP